MMKYGMKKEEFEDLINNGDNSNANLSFSPEMVVEYTYEAVAKEYNLSIMPKQSRKAYLDGFVHHHDLHGAILKPNCLNHNIRFYAKNGLKIDGKGENGAVAKPAKSLEVLLNHMLQAFMAGACVLTGGQAFTNFNTFLAPFAEGRSYSDIKQAIQGFIFNCNMSLVARGGQVLFSSIGLDLSMPDVLKDIPAICPDNVVKGTYKDYVEEFNLIFRAVCEVLNEKDGQGAYFKFPNTLFSIRDGDLDEYTGNCKLLHELGANNPTIYYVNCTDAERTVMGCFSSDTCLWVKIDDELKYLSFNEIDKLLNANIGVTPVNNIEVLTIDDNRKIIWHKAKNFIKNEPQELYKIKLVGNKSFVCDKNHTMITYKAMNKKNILDCKSNLLDVVCILNDDQYCLKPDKRSALYGFYLGDGNKGNNFKKGFANLMLLKSDKIEYARDLLISLDVDFKEKIVHHSRDNEDYTVFYFSADEIVKPDLLDVNNCAGLLEGMLSSDGYVRLNKGGFDRTSLSAEFVSTDLEISRLFKFACFNLGIKFSSRLIQPSKNQKNRVPFERVYLSCNYESVNIFKQLNLRKKQKILCDEISNNFRHINETKGQSVKEIIPLNETDYTYCFEVNGRIIVGSDFILTGNCRTANQLNYTGDYFRDCLGAGNFMYSTLNLPLIALTYKNDFFKYLDKYIEIIYDTLKWRREQVTNTIYNKHMSDFLLWEDDEDKLYNFDTSSMTIGVCGLYECVKTLEKIDGFVDNIDDFYDDGLGVRIMKFINDKVNEFKKRDGLRWGVLGSPAESTAYKFGKINVEKFPDEAIFQGTKDTPYLTNSTHIPVNHESNIIDHIRNADMYHPLTRAGNILHLWLGEVWSDPVSLWRLNQKIISTGTQFWAYSKVFTYCQQCGYTINDNLEECPICKSKDLRVYDRVSGYYLPIKTWNEGKKQEFKDRFRHKYI